MNLEFQLPNGHSHSFICAIFSLVCIVYTSLIIIAFQNIQQLEHNVSPQKFTFDTFRLGSKTCFNGWQLAKMKKSIPDMSLP